MASAAFFLAPALVLAGMWSLLSAFDNSALDRRRQVAVAAGCLAAAVVLTVLGIALDDQAAAPPRTPSTTTARD